MIIEYNGLTIDLSRDSMFSDSGLLRMKDGYLMDDETSPQQRFANVSVAFSSNIEHAQRLYEYSSKMWLSYATPVLSYSKSRKHALPISCFASYLGDSVDSLLRTSTETRRLAVVGGGVGLHVNLRPGDKKSSGIMPHLKTYDVDTLAYKQGTTRRGATAAYLDINHPEIIDFIEMRKPTGGDPNRKCLNLHHGVNVTDDFMNRIHRLSTDSTLTQSDIDELDKYPLIDPNTKEVHSYISAKSLWERILTIRMETGEPYIVFKDTANSKLHPALAAAGYAIHGSNLCSEIMLPTKARDEFGEARTFVCCLSSLNLEKYDSWKDDKMFIPDIIEMLDNVLDLFMEKAASIPEMAPSINSARGERSVGLGALGWHALLQSRKIAWESPMAVSLNKSIWRDIGNKVAKAERELAIRRGEAPELVSDVTFIVDGGSVVHHIRSSDVVVDNDGKHIRGFDIDVGNKLVGYGEVIEVNKSEWAGLRRHAHSIAIAPNASTSIILGTSPSIEPYRANVYLEKGVNGTHVHKNKYLEELLENRGKNTQEVWSQIISDDGSVVNLDFLTDIEKMVFKTAMEIDQSWILQHAADRQDHVCQAQSLNLFFNPTVNIEYLHYIHLLAWQCGLKSLYYCRSDAMRKADKVGKSVERERLDVLKDISVRVSSGDETMCVACEG